MLVVVTSISLCVHVYSLGYMKGDVRFTWFYAVLSLFTARDADVVVLANNLFQLLVGWEIMGVCSYLLIGHWWEDKVNSNAAIKAFITTRVGDVPFMFGIFVLISHHRFHDLEHPRDQRRGLARWGARWRSCRRRRCCCSAARSASPRSSRSTSGCPTRWRARRRSRR